MLTRVLILKGSSLTPVQRMVRHSRLFKPLVQRFIAGETLDEAMAVSAQLMERGFKVTLDYLGENAQTEAESLQAKSSYVQMLDRISAQKLPPATPDGYANGDVEDLNISIKLTQCGLDQGDDFAERNYRDVVHRAADSGTFVRVDMEGSPYTERTVQIVGRVHEDLKNTGTVVQSYLHRTPADIEWAVQNGIRLRLVKGAYLEGAEVAYQDKDKVDRAFVESAERLLDAGLYPAFATHDERIVNKINAMVVAKGIDRRKFEFQMLYGIRRDLQESLLKEGFRVRVYVPFGESWYPYFTRRLAERPANTIFLLKSLFKG